MIQPGSKGVNFIDKNDAAVRAGPSSFKKLSYSLWPNTYEQLLELRSNNFDEFAISLVS